MKHIDAVSLLNEFGVPFLRRDSGWLTITCPFHNDSEDLKEAVGGIKEDTGAFNCFSCNQSGNVLTVISKRFGVPTEAIQAHHDNIFGTNNKIGANDEALIELCHRNLCESQEYLTKINNKHGITLDTVKQFNLGLYPATKRVIIPIKAPDGTIGDIRQYKYDKLESGEGKIISKSKARTLLFTTCDPTKEDTLYLAEGEFKAMLLWQYGFPAMSVTHGATSWRDEFDRVFRDKNVVIIYDVDKPGRKNAEKRAIGLALVAKSVKNVYLQDVEDIDNGDITDFFVKKGLSADHLKEVVAKTPIYKPYEPPELTEDDSPPIAVTLAGSAKAEHNGKLVTTTAVISAKDTAPYIIPGKVEVICPRSKDYCINCPAFEVKDEDLYTITIKSDSATVLDLIAAKGSEKLEAPLFKQLGRIPNACKSCSFRTKESMNVEEIRVIPQLAAGHATDEQVTRRVFYVGSGINTNASYAMSARVTSMPGDGHATLVVYNAEATVDNIDNFKATEDLSLFKPTEWTVKAIEDKLNEIYTDYESNVTRIKQRRDLHLVYDLAFHSVLYVPYEGRNIKGWADILVIGDSGQGKSEASSRMSIHYKAGERVDSKRASVAGIVGGLQETSNRWFITWGSIPLNDRRLVILEEVKGMGVGELTKLTDMRSSGFAEIHKIERAKTHARTRLIWISNPRSDNKISAYNYGVDAVRELIGSLEDIRRFDLVCAVASGEVDISVINAQHTSTVPHRFTTEKCAELVQWAWSRKERDIQVGPDTIAAALAASTRLSQTYSSAIPIVEPSDQRLKMLRLATALAARTYSTEDGENLVVRPCHVEVVEALMNRLYKSKALGYYDFSKASKGEDTITDIVTVKAHIDSMPHAVEAAKCLLEADNIRIEDLQNFTDWPLEKCNEMIGNFVRTGCLKRSKRGGYRKTVGFIDQLKESIQSGMLSNESFKEKLQKGSEL